jgi:hypothetical protein
MVDPLEVAHLLEYFVGDTRIAPLDVPIFSLAETLGLPVEVLRAADLLQDGVLGVLVMEVILERLTVAVRALVCLSRIYR